MVAYWTTYQEKSIASRPREETRPLYLELVRLHIDYRVQFRKVIEKPEQVQLRATKIARGLGLDWRRGG